MRALRLEYGSRQAARPLGTLVLLAGFVLALAVLLQYRAAREDLLTQEAKTAEIRKSGKRGPPTVRATPKELEAAAQEYRLAQLALQRLSLRWNELFAALESTRPSGVALLAIEPDPGKSSLKLTAEAKTADDMLDYVERLQSAGGLADVVLASHQIKQGDPLQPLRFVVLASWVK
jgi:Tfp pilus assembly protein PilN